MRQGGWGGLIVSLVALAAAADTGPPEMVVKRLDEALLAAMKLGPGGGLAGRAERLAPAIAEAFDMDAMTRMALGANAVQLAPEDILRLRQAFLRYTVASYAAQFDAWKGENFEEGASRPATGGRQVVPARIIAAGGQATELDYVFHLTGEGEWKIVDVLLDGAISQLAVRRSEFSSVYRRQGLSGLIDLLDRKTSALAVEGQ